MGLTPVAYADEVSERIVRSYIRAMAIIEECKLEVPSIVYVRLLDFGKNLQGRMAVSDEEAQRYAEEEKAAFDVTTSSCDFEDDRVASVLGFVEEQATIVGVQTGLGVRDPDAINLLGGLFMVVATIEYCQIEIDTSVAGAIGLEAQDLQDRLGMSMERSQDIYAKTLAGIRVQAPECAVDDSTYATTMQAIETYGAIAATE